jgi:carotenoid cleavage dioxygenase-like enzyme
VEFYLFFNLFQLLNISGGNLGELKKLKVTFSAATWEDVAPHFDLDPKSTYLVFETFSVPKVSLPHSFHTHVHYNVILTGPHTYNYTAVHRAQEIRETVRERPAKIQNSLRATMKIRAEQ